jgi:hypothetical protein
MKGKLIVLLLVITLLASGAGLAATDSISLPWWTVDGGGAAPALSGGGLWLHGTTGQADAGTLSNGRFSLSGGYWNPSTANPTRWVYLPIVAK